MSEERKDFVSAKVFQIARYNYDIFLYFCHKNGWLLVSFVLVKWFAIYLGQLGKKWSCQQGSKESAHPEEAVQSLDPGTIVLTPHSKKVHVRHCIQEKQTSCCASCFVIIEIRLQPKPVKWVKNRRIELQRTGTAFIPQEKLLLQVSYRNLTLCSKERQLENAPDSYAIENTFCVAITNPRDTRFEHRGTQNSRPAVTPRLNDIRIHALTRVTSKPLSTAPSTPTT